MIPISACGNTPPDRRSGKKQTRDYTGRIRLRFSFGTNLAACSAYNFSMSRRFRLWIFLLFCAAGYAQEKSPAASEAVTVSATIDHNRVVIEAEVRAPGGSSRKVHVWVDNGDAELNVSRQLATALGLAISCDDNACSSPPPAGITIGGINISFAGIKQTKIPLKTLVIASGVNAEINLPSSVLRNYDVLIDFPDHKFSIGPQGSMHFLGSSGKVQINAENGLIQIPSEIENKKYNLALDLGSSISFLSGELFDKLSTAHANWPHMTGAVGSANMWGLVDEPKWNVMRVDRVHYGPLFLTNVPVVEMPKDWLDFFAKRAGVPTAGLLGAEALLNYRVGLDYAHSMVYFDIGRLFNFPDFDVIGLILRPEDDGRFTILGVADLDGKASVPERADGVQPGDTLAAVDGIPIRGSTMGQVWSMLGGTPGQERKLTVERAGKQLTISATVQHFLAEAPDEEPHKRKK
jgi:hypothetical protein